MKKKLDDGLAQEQGYNMVLKSVTEYGLILNDELTVLWEMYMEAICHRVHLLDANVLQVAQPKGTTHNAL